MPEYDPYDLSDDDGPEDDDGTCPCCGAPAGDECDIDCDSWDEEL